MNIDIHLRSNGLDLLQRPTRNPISLFEWIQFHFILGFCAFGIIPSVSLFLKLNAYLCLLLLMFKKSKSISSNKHVVVISFTMKAMAIAQDGSVYKPHCLKPN
jgi:hypothetical protein